MVKVSATELQKIQQKVQDLETKLADCLLHEQNTRKEFLTTLRREYEHSRDAQYKMLKTMKMMKISPEGTVYVPNRKPTAISSILPASGQVNANSIQERATAVHDLMGSPVSVTNREDTSEGDRTCSDLQTLFRTHSVGPTTWRGARTAVGAHAVDSGQLTGKEDTNMSSRRSPSPIGQELIAPDTNLCARRSGSPIRQESIAPDSAHAVSENSFDTATPSVQATLPVQENQTVTMSEPTSEQTEAPNVPLSNTNGMLHIIMLQMTM